MIARTLLAAALLVTAAVPAKADLCANLSSLANTVIETKYRGVPLSAMMGKIDEIIEGETAQELMRELVMGAYELPNYSTKHYQVLQAQEFSNEWAVTCYRALASRDD